jgi:hypothetical protein
MKTIAHILAQICFILFLNTETSAQEKLTRKPWFGAQYSYIDAEKKTGCIITRIAGGTSQALKLQKDDVIEEGQRCVCHNMHLGGFDQLTDF